MDDNQIRASLTKVIDIIDLFEDEPHLDSWAIGVLTDARQILTDLLYEFLGVGR